MPYQSDPSPKFYHLAVGPSALGEAIAGSDINATYTIRNAFTSHQGPWNTTDGVADHGTVARWARAHTAPLAAVWVDAGLGGHLPTTHSFASVDQPNIVMPVVKAAEDRDGYVVRLHETAGMATVATVSAPFAGSNLTWTMSTTAERDVCRLESVRGSQVSVPMEEHELVTLRIREGAPPAGVPPCRGSDHE